MSAGQKYWTVPRMWEEGECWILGGGPSLPEQFGVPEDVMQDVRQGRKPVSAYSPFLSSIRNKHVIGVNMAFKLGEWISVLLFGDEEFYRGNKLDILRWRGLRVSCVKRLSGSRKDDPMPKFVFPGVKMLEKVNTQKKGISPDPSVLYMNNSGGAAINFAAHAGVKRIVLVGFDMNKTSTGTHWHQLYEKRSGWKPPFKKHLKGFPAIARDAERMGIEIINACPNSAIQEFRKANVKDLL